MRFAPAAPTEDVPAFLGAVKDSANQIELYLDFAAKTGQKPDFSGPPLSNLFARVFDLKKLAALPPPKASDVPMLLARASSANEIAKAIMYFGITPPADPIADQEGSSATSRTLRTSRRRHSIFSSASRRAKCNRRFY